MGNKITKRDEKCPLITENNGKKKLNFEEKVYTLYDKVYTLCDKGFL
ncbi:hypothetical protein ES705_44492 [subsurface metagenome]